MTMRALNRSLIVASSAGVGAKELFLAEYAGLQELHEYSIHPQVSAVLAHALHE